MTSTRRDRVVIIGLGSIGLRHLDVIRESYPNTILGALSGKDKAIIPQGISKVFRNFSEIEQFHPKLAIICTPAPFHVGMAMRLAEIGTHLLIEKPIGVNINEVNKLINICKKKNLALATGYNLRYLPSLVFFRQYIHRNFLGKIYSIESFFNSYMPEWRPNIDYKNSVSARSELGGGVLFEMSHEIDYLRWIFGEVSWVNAVLSKQSKLEINVADSAYISMECKRDNCVVPVKLSLDFYRQDSRRFCEVIGEKGILMWDYFSNSVKFFDGETRVWSYLYSNSFDRNLTYTEQYKNFIHSIDETVNPGVSGIDGLKALEIILASEESNINKTTVLLSKIRTHQ